MLGASIGLFHLFVVSKAHCCNLITCKVYSLFAHQRYSIGSQILINQLRRFTSSKVCIWIRRRADFLLKETGKDFCCLGTAYLFIRVSEGSIKVLARFKVKEGRFGLR